MSIVQEREEVRTSGAWAPDTVAGVRDAVHDAAAERIPLRLVGLGTWLDGGHPATADARPLRLGALEGITAYVPGDLTLTARAGTPLTTIEAAAQQEGQWLPLDPFSSAAHGGSIGATIATASAGPLALGLGLPRDIVLGLEAVTGEGVIIHTGGRVVKNVAGFDLTRLFTGAWGTLAVLTEVTIRLRGRPVCDETLVVTPRPARSGTAQEDGTGALPGFLRALRAAPVIPIAFELLNERLAARLGIGGGAPTPVALIRIAGNSERIAAERAALQSLGEVTPVDPALWSALRRIESGAGTGPAVVRWSQPPTRLDATWAHATSVCAASPDALIHASVARGIVRAIIPEARSASLTAAIACDSARVAGGGDPAESGDVSAYTGTCVPERLPPWLWGAVGTRGPRDLLSRRVRRAFDPAHILNPGVLGEGADRD